MNQLAILKLAKKKRGLTIRDFWYYDLEQMVHEDMLHKTFPKKVRVPGWPLYIISRRGRKILTKTLAQQLKGRKNG